MLYVDRNRISLPRDVTRALAAAHAEAVQFYKSKKDRSQKRFLFRSEPWQLARESLRELFYDTCAYCESPESWAELGVDHFRPTTEASNLDGQSDSDWYWWLAYKWENLYLVCSSCIHNKNKIFPVTGKRLPRERAYGDSTSENYLLIDPCRDEPTDYLWFKDDGTVEAIMSGKEPHETTSRGAVTIRVLGLNRPDLVLRRKQVVDRAKSRLHAFRPRARKHTPEQLKAILQTIEELINEYSDFVAVKRYFVARFFLAHPALHERLLGAYKTDVRRIDRDLKPYVTVEQSLMTLSRRRRAVPKQVTAVKEEIEVEHDSVCIRQIEISNFRNIHYLNLHLETELSNPKKVLGSEQPIAGGLSFVTGWKMLLGENGAGKSSVLKALALALMGSTFYEANKERNGLTTEKIFNRNATKTTGFIKITLSKGEIIHVRFTKSKLKFVSGAEGAKGTFIRGFGSARLFSPAGPSDPTSAERNSENVLQRVDNLLRPHEVLLHPIEWLKANSGAINSSALSLRDLLNLSTDIDRPLSQQGDEILLNTGNGPFPLAEQSDGYKTVLAFVLDILAGLPTSVHDKSTASGIVLIDELDSHLHPKWKMRIVKSLRQTFPKLQFIATTHEPLCLRGLGQGEITVMKKVDNVVQTYDRVPSPENLRIDQLLTSELFGLESTIDPIIDEKFYNYYQLLANSTEASSKLTAKEREKLINELKLELSQYNTLGFTRRDQMVYDLIDDYLKLQGKRPKTIDDRLKKETKKRVFELWDLINLKNNGSI